LIAAGRRVTADIHVEGENTVTVILRNSEGEELERIKSVSDLYRPLGDGKGMNTNELLGQMLPPLP
jgi:hypothetical protein